MKCHCKTFYLKFRELSINSSQRDLYVDGRLELLRLANWRRASRIYYFNAIMEIPSVL